LVCISVSENERGTKAGKSKRQKKGNFCSGFNGELAASE
jgi:hypothetical protein